MLCGSLNGRQVGERMDTYICMTESFYSPPETITAWLISYRCSVAKSCLTLFDPIDYSTSGSLSFTICWSLLKLLSIELVMVSSHLTSYTPI